MVMFSVAARQFISYLSAEEKKELLHSLSVILPRLQKKAEMADKPSLLLKAEIHCIQLLQFKNQCNDEIVIREVQKTNFFYHLSYIEVFYNLEEISFDFIFHICHLLEQESATTCNYSLT